MEELKQEIKVPEENKILLKKEYMKKYMKEYYQKNKKKINEKNKLWKLNNVEKVRELNRNWARRNYNKLLEWRKNNPKKVIESKLKWIKNNIEKNKQCKRYWAKRNPEKSNKWLKNHPEKQREYAKVQRIKYKDKYICRRKLNDRIKSDKLPKPTEFNCSLCDDKAQEYHHLDYTKPFLVIPICVSCHRDFHKKYRGEII